MRSARQTNAVDLKGRLRSRVAPLNRSVLIVAWHAPLKAEFFIEGGLFGKGLVEAPPQPPTILFLQFVDLAAIKSAVPFNHDAVIVIGAPALAFLAGIDDAIQEPFPPATRLVRGIPCQSFLRHGLHIAGKDVPLAERLDDRCTIVVVIVRHELEI